MGKGSDFHGQKARGNAQLSSSVLATSCGCGTGHGVSATGYLSARTKLTTEISFLPTATFFSQVLGSEKTGR
jgi:hypothetical protein